MAHAAKYAASASGHMLSHYDRSKDGLSGNIDHSRTHLNYNLGPEREGSQLDFIHQRMSEVRCLKRADVNIMCDWVVTLPKYQWHDNNIHMTPNKEQVERTFFERVYRFMADRYGEQNVISAYVHRDETTPHMHFAFVPVTEDKKRGGEKLSAKEVVTRKDLQTFHTDLERHLDSFRDWHFEVVNEATKDGNKTIAELKKQTAHEEVLKAQQEALQARQRALQEQESIKLLVEQKNALRGEIEALQTEKEVLTAAEVEAIKGEKTLLGGLKGVTYKEFEAVKRTALAVDSITAERDQALARAERADLRATLAEAKVERAYADANRQLQAKIAEVEQDRPSLKMTQENIRLRKENQSLKAENSTLQDRIANLDGMVRYLLNIIREKLPEVYAAFVQRRAERQQQPTQEKPKPKSKGWER
jgi:FtsZ-binding cell division protein ZapB